jgi:hypothetical protein
MDISHKAADAHQSSRIGRGIHLHAPISGHVIGMSVRHKAMRCHRRIHIKSDVKSRKMEATE